MFPSKAFSMSELNIYQILKLNYYKKLQEWWTDEVDGDCISFICLETQKVQKFCYKDGEEIICQIYQQCFYLEELTQIGWSISKKQSNGRAYETEIGDKEHQFGYCFEFDTNTKSRFVRISFDRLFKFNRLPVVYTTIYQKENDKNVYFGNFFSLVRNRTNRKKFCRNFKI